MTYYVGLSGASNSWLISKIIGSGPTIVLCQDRRTSERIAEDLKFFLRDIPTLHFTDWETLPLEPVSPQIYISAQRILTLQKMLACARLVVVTSVSAVCQRIHTPQMFRSLGFTLNRAQAELRSDLLNKFDLCGFRRTSLVEEVGDLAVRGGTLDFFPSSLPNPVRIEFFGDTIERMRLFEPDSQRTFADIDSTQVLPVQEFLSIPLLPDRDSLIASGCEKIKRRAQALETPSRELSGNLETFCAGTHIPGMELIQAIALEPLATFFDYIPPQAELVVVDQGGVSRTAEAFWDLIGERAALREQEHYLLPARETMYVSPQELSSHLSRHTSHFIDGVVLSSPKQEERSARVKFETLPQTELAAKMRTQIGTGQALSPLKALIERWRTTDSRVAFAVGAPHRAERLQRFLLEIGIDAPILESTAGEWEEVGPRLPVAILLGHLSEGFQLPTEKLIYVSERDIFGERSYRKPRHSSTSTRRILSSISLLVEGDYVVHADYGIGIYRGLNHKVVSGVESDLLHIEYADSKLFLPVQNIGKVQKFIASEGKTPTIAKLGSRQWQLTKQRVRKSVEELAGQLIRLYAARSITKGWRFDTYGAEDERFADSFPFSETPDQLHAIEETLKDMAAEKPMDRLICGDVGFGKTEVALRAAFKCIQHARQVALLAPTTLLVEQHKQNFLNRFAEYPVKIAAVSRFYTAQQNRETLALLASGTLDIIIGTHRLLQSDIVFKDLGLIIIDEEHRFGVKQKERLKQLRTQVDVLTLTATPIPRTLHMGLLGIRDISIINTAPHDRRAIQTYIAPKDDTLVRDAILRELQRGGQVFYVYNRVETIDLVCTGLQQLVPDARFAFAHGQMSEHQLENIMRNFLEAKIDVLVTTTIIESGLDIPSANTIIIERADTYGLAQLYQLRGRVGRSKRQAYAYLLIPQSEHMGDAAQKRLKVLQSLDELGVGFNLAVKDLEIRGAGNLLGREQSGSVLEVGFELYTKILKEAVHHLKGDSGVTVDALDPEVKLEVSAYIPNSYIPDISERLLLYQRMAGVVSEIELSALIDEIHDRFGAPPEEVENLIELSRLRTLFKIFGVAKADLAPEKLSLSFAPQAPIDSAKIIKLIQSKPKNYKLKKDNSLIVLPEERLNLHEEPRLSSTLQKVLREIGAD